MRWGASPAFTRRASLGAIPGSEVNTIDLAFLVISLLAVGLATGRLKGLDRLGLCPGRLLFPRDPGVLRRALGHVAAACGGGVSAQA